MVSLRGFDATKVSPDYESDLVDFAHINDQISGRSLSFVQALAPDGKQRGHKYEWRANYRNERNIGSAYIDLNSGQWADMGGSAKGGDFVSFYAFHHDIRDQIEAARRLAEEYSLSIRPGSFTYVGKMKLSDNPPLPSSEEQSKAKALEIQEMIEKGRPIQESDRAGLYLKSRGIDPVSDAILTTNKDGSEILFFIGRDNDSGAKCGQQIFLNESGKKVGKAKYSLGPIKGHPFRLFASGTDNRLLICEGPEDAISLWQATGLETWAMFGSSNLASAPALNREVLIVADNDGREETINHTTKAIQNLRDRGNKVGVWYPERTLGDANDILLNKGAFELSRLVLAAFNQSGEIETAPETVEERPKLTFDRPSLYAGQTPPKRQWIVEGLIPEGAVTGIWGEPGVGKSLLSLQLLNCLATGEPFLGYKTKQSKVMAFFCEDDNDETRRRQRGIEYGLRLNANEIDNLLYQARVGEQNLLVEYDGDKGRTTPFYDQIVECGIAEDIDFLLLDNIAQMFGGNENSRVHATQFMNFVADLGKKIGCTVVVIGHPNKSGDSYSGSTAWEACVRSRLHLAWAKDEDGNEKPGVRVLGIEKSNYAKKGQQVETVFRDGALVEMSPKMMNEVDKIRQRNQDKDDEDAFLVCLAEMTAQNRPVSDSKNTRNYAPKVFAGMPKQREAGIGSKRFELAMERLFSSHTILAGQPVGEYSNRTKKYGIALYEEADNED